MAKPTKANLSANSLFDNGQDSNKDCDLLSTLQKEYKRDVYIFHTCVIDNHACQCGRSTCVSIMDLAWCRGTLYF